MKPLLINILCGLVLGAAAMPAVARADEANRKTILTFDEPVEIPGRVLPAGRYEFRLLDSSDDQAVVEVSSANEKHVLATLLAIPRYRSRVPGKTVITFKQRAPGAPPAIQAWFYPGDPDGLEFVYPKARAIALARTAQQPVKATSDEAAAQMNATEAAAQEAAVAALKEAPILVAQPSGEVVELSEVFTAAPSLPRTASQMPVELIVGLALLALGIALHVGNRNVGVK